jgi:hypothetical protein
VATIHQYIAWCEQRIASLVIKEGFHLGLVRVVQGPLTITYHVRLLRPSSGQLQKLLRLGPTIAAVLQVESVRVCQANGDVHIQIPSPIKHTPQATELTRATQGLTACVGVNALRQPMTVNLKQHGAIFWIGPSRRGKTQSMKSTLYTLIRRNGSRLKYAILCHAGKQDNWQAFSPAVGCMGIVTDPDEQHQVLRWATEELLGKGLGPFTYVVVVDDLLNLLSQAELAGHLGDIASIGAGLGVHLLVGTQEAGSRRGSGGAGVETNITAKILYKPANAATGARSAGQKGVQLDELTGAKGDALLLVDGFGERIATGWIDDRTILQLPAKEDNYRLIAPWRDTRSGAVLQNGMKLPRTGQNGGVPTPHGTQDALIREGDTPERSPLLPLPGNRPPNPKERELLRQLYAKLGSKEKVYPRAWGYKNGKVQRYLTQAIAESPLPDSTDTLSQPAKTPILDMNTPQGQAVVDHLIAQGLLPKDTISQVVLYQRKE